MQTSYWRTRRGAGHTDTTTDATPPARTDVVVVGAGITGLMVATELANRGLQVAVVDRRTPAAGTTGSSTAKVTALHGTAIGQITQRHGLEAARRYVEANRLGVHQLRRTVARLDLDCGWAETWASIYTTDASALDGLQAEHAAALDAGLPVVYLDELELPVGAVGAVALEEQASIDPVRLCGGLVDRLRAAGHHVVSGCAVEGIEPGPPPVVHTQMGTLTANHVVVATLMPVVDPDGLFARVEPMMSYALAATLRVPVPEGLHLGIDEPTRSIRPLAPGSRTGIFGGGGHRVGEQGDRTTQRDDLRAWVHAHFEVASVEAEWSAHDLVPADGIPFIGRSGMDGVLLASGFRKWGFSHAGAASLLLADLVTGLEPEWGRVFDPRRSPLSSLGAAAALAKGNLSVGRHLIGDRAGSITAPAAEALAPGDGGIVDVDGDKVAAHRRADGELLARSRTCTHLGCEVKWNTSASTWDCPCHGSRFEPDGTVVAGPAIRPLGPAAVPAADAATGDRAGRG
jgi:glycine/D-amino acid oxidase-like deaminating enzyme/nitrite reductase/ring-hydroxylating ferredoxin subunit